MNRLYEAQQEKEMLGLAERYRSKFVYPSRRKKAFATLSALLPGLSELKEKLESVQKCLLADTVEKPMLLVEFFNIVSPWHDRVDELWAVCTALREAPGSDLAAVRYHLEEVLIPHVTKAGRNIYGMNRTEPGQYVLSNAVFLGESCGLWTETVAYWHSKKDDQTEVARDTSNKPMTAYAVVSWQAEVFMESHLKKMIEATGYILRTRSS